jgi:serine/threonine protein kinase
MQERDVFIAAVPKNAVERAAYLAEACGDDRELRSRVEQLLVEHEKEQSFFLDAPLPVAQMTIDQPLQEKLGTQIGPYKLLQQIGEGGMGVVFMAEQMAPMQRRVALKIIKPGMDTRQVIARFEAERQALALMDHVNIARVFDAGATEQGRPYFVMELVNGVPITKYCDDNRLTPRQRLELFVPVCQAIQHAHQKGIIHRDIKPSNVMVTLYDGKPVPKVIDFGVAKAIEQKLTERTLFTQFGTMVGTLEYMSPEQAEMSALGVDTRSDIYSLGVLLYELLTGSTPLSTKQMKEAAYAEILRLIKEEEPPKPSTRLSDSGEALASISAQRHTEPAKLSKLMRGELDWIVMKTLEKDRNRRYETANGFAADVQRYLSGEAVQAVPPSAGYRVRNFARRNQAALVMITTVVVLLLSGTIISTWQALRATKAERLAEARLLSEREARHDAEQANEKASKNFGRAREAVKRMLTRVAQNQLSDVPRMELVRKTLLEDALQFYEQLMAERTADPEIRFATAQARLDLAFINGRRGETAEEHERIQLALELLEPLVKEFPEDLRYRSGLALALHLQSHQTAWTPNRWKEAEQLLRRAIELQESVAFAIPDSAEHAHHLADMLQMLGNALATGSQSEEAEAVYRRAVSIAEQITAKDPNDPAHLHAQVRGLASIANLLSVKDPEQAEAILLRAQVLAKRFNETGRKTGILFDNCAYALASVEQGLGELYHAQGRTKEAQAAFRRAWAVYQKYTSDFPSVRFYRERLAWASQRLADSLTDPDDGPEAERLYREAVEVHEKLVADFPKVAIYRKGLSRAYRGLGNSLRKIGRPDDAEKVFRGTINRLETLTANFPQDLEPQLELSAAYQDLAYLEEAAKRPTEALEAFRKSLEVAEHAAAKYPDQAIVWETVGHKARTLSWPLRRANHLADSEATHVKAVEAFERAGKIPGASTHTFRYLAAETRRGQAEVVLAQKRPKDAEDLFRKSVEDCYTLPGDFFVLKPERHRSVGAGIDRYALFLRGHGRPQEAIEALQQGVNFFAKLSQDMPKEAVLKEGLSERYRRFAWFLAAPTNPKDRDGKRIVELAKNAVELAPESGICWNTLGIAYYRAGDWKDAVASLEKAMELRKDGDGTDWFFLAMAHAQQQNKDEARKWYDRATAWMDNQPDNEELRRFRDEAATLLGVKD